MGTNVNGCWVWAFLKTEKTQNVLNLSVWVWVYLLASFRPFHLCCGAGKQKSENIAAEKQGKACGEEMDLQPDELTGPAAGSESCCSRGRVCSGQHADVCGPADLQQRRQADGAFRGPQRKGWRGRRPLEIPSGGYSPPGHFPMAGQAGSRSVLQTPRCSAVTFLSSTASAPPTLPYPLRKCLMSSPSPMGTCCPPPSPSPALCLHTPGFQRHHLFSTCSGYLF